MSAQARDVILSGLSNRMEIHDRLSALARGQGPAVSLAPQGSYQLDISVGVHGSDVPAAERSYRALPGYRIGVLVVQCPLSGVRAATGQGANWYNSEEVECRLSWHLDRPGFSPGRQVSPVVLSQGPFAGPRSVGRPPDLLGPRSSSEASTVPLAEVGDSVLSQTSSRPTDSVDSGSPGWNRQVRMEEVHGLSPQSSLSGVRLRCESPLSSNSGDEQEHVLSEFDQSEAAELHRRRAVRRPRNHQRWACTQQQVHGGRVLRSTAAYRRAQQHSAQSAAHVQGPISNQARESTN